MKKIFLFTMIFMLILGLGFAVAEDDPFADLGGSDDGGLAAPDGSSSIRAKKKAVPEMFEGKIKAIQKSKTFPMVRALQIEISKPPKCTKAPHNELVKKETYLFRVDFKMGKDGKLDMADSNNQENMGAWYFDKNDKVEGVIKEAIKGKKGQYVLEFVQRK